MLSCYRWVMVLIAVSFAVVGARAADGGTVTVAKVRSKALGDDLNYYVYLPVAYARDTTTRFPVVYLLHGRGDSMEAWRTMVPDLDRMIVAKEIPPVIAIMPDAPSSQRAGYYIDSQFKEGKRVETAFVSELIPYIDATYRTEPSRAGRVVAGYSMGGYGALRYALAHPELFASAIVLSPAVYFPVPPRASSTREFGAFGKGEALFDETVYREKNYPAVLTSFRRAGLPLLMFIAVGDDEKALEDPQEAAHDLDYEAHTLYNHVRREPGITAELRVMNGGHNWDTWRPGFIDGMRAVFVSKK